jgi:hypothetical protein
MAFTSASSYCTSAVGLRAHTLLWYSPAEAVLVVAQCTVRVLNSTVTHMQHQR